MVTSTQADVLASLADDPPELVRYLTHLAGKCPKPGDGTPAKPVAVKVEKTPIERARAAKRLKKLMAADPFKRRNPRVACGMGVTRQDVFQARKDLGGQGLIPTAGPTVANRAPSRPSSIPRTREPVAASRRTLLGLAPEPFKPSDDWTPGLVPPGAPDDCYAPHCATWHPPMAI